MTGHDCCLIANSGRPAVSALLATALEQQPCWTLQNYLLVRHISHGGIPLVFKVSCHQKHRELLSQMCQEGKKKWLEKAVQFIHC